MDEFLSSKYEKYGRGRNNKSNVLLIMKQDYNFLLKKIIFLGKVFSE